MSPRRAPPRLQGQGCAVALDFLTMSPHSGLWLGFCVLNPHSCGWRLLPSPQRARLGSRLPDSWDWDPESTHREAGGSCHAAKDGCPPGLADCPRMRADAEGCLEPSGSAGLCLGLPSGPTRGRLSGGSSREPGRDWLVLKICN